MKEKDKSLWSIQITNAERAKFEKKAHSRGMTLADQLREWITGDEVLDLQQRLNSAEINLELALAILERVAENDDSLKPKLALLRGEV